MLTAAGRTWPRVAPKAVAANAKSALTRCSSLPRSASSVSLHFQDDRKIFSAIHRVNRTEAARSTVNKLATRLRGLTCVSAMTATIAASPTERETIARIVEDRLITQDTSGK